MADGLKQHVWPAAHGVVGQSMPPPLEPPLPELLPLEPPLPEPPPLEPPLPELLPLELPLPELLPLEPPFPELLPLEPPLPELLPLEPPLPELLPLELPLPELLPLEPPLPELLPLEPPLPELLPLELPLVASIAWPASAFAMERFPVPSTLSPHATANAAQATAPNRPRETHILNMEGTRKRPPALAGSGCHRVWQAATLLKDATHPEATLLTRYALRTMDKWLGDSAARALLMGRRGRGKETPTTKSPTQHEHPRLQGPALRRRHRRVCRRSRSHREVLRQPAVEHRNGFRDRPAPLAGLQEPDGRAPRRATPRCRSTSWKTACSSRPTTSI